VRRSRVAWSCDEPILQERDFGLVLERYLHFFGHAEIEIFWRAALNRGWTRSLDEMVRLLSLNADELSRKVHPWGDEEDQLPPINVFLWKQKVGEISPDLRILYKFEDSYNAWLPHRYMIANGYEEEGLALPRFETPRHTSYRKEILRLLDCLHHPGMRSDPTELSYLASCLSVLGPKLAEDPLGEQAWDLLDYVTANLQNDTDTQLVHPADFTLLVHDLGYPAEASWPAFEFFVTKSQDADLIWSFPAWFIGCRIYGERALEAVRQVDLPIDWTLLEELSGA
jgi:hypothetical protein